VLCSALSSSSMSIAEQEGQARDALDDNGKSIFLSGVPGMSQDVVFAAPWPLSRTLSHRM